MKKIRVLLLLLVVLLVPCLMFIACGDDEGAANCDVDGHTWRFADNPHKQTLISSVTCTTPEIRERECKVCGFTERYESKEPTGHRYDSMKKIYLNDATCETNGHTVLHCYMYERCGYVADKIEEVPGTATGHTFLHYVPTLEDPTIGVAKCVDCDATDTVLLGVKLDMEGDRSHLSYDALMVNTTKVESSKDYTGYKTVGNNTYLSVTRPELGTYVGGTDFGVVITPNANALENKIYVFEAVLFLDQNAELPSGDIQIVGKKAQLGQELPFITYNSANKTIDGIAGAVYGLTDEDYENGVKISLLINDKEQWYQIFVNDKLVSKNENDDPDQPPVYAGTIAYAGDYYPGVQIGTISIIATGTDATEFGVDNIRLYTASKPDGYNGGLNQSYTTVSLSTGEQVSIKLPDAECTHNYVAGTPKLQSCVTAGYTVETCTECKGQRIVNEVAPDGHSLGEAVVYAPDCFNAGYTVQSCSKCGVKVGYQSAPKLEHVHGDDAVYTEPTCKDDATTEGECVLCGTFFEVVHERTAHGHELDASVATVINPTCSTDGYTHGLCKHCGEEYTDPDSIVKAFGHYAFEYETHIADCFEEGYKKYTCLSCGEEQKEKTESVLGHKLFTKTEVVGGRTQVTHSCVNCEYSFTFEAVDTPPTYNQIKDKLVYSYYQDDKATSDKLCSDGGDYKKGETIAGFKNYVQWVNDSDNKYATFIGGTGGGDGYFNFPANDLGIKDNTVWEFDVKFPDEGFGLLDVDSFATQGVSLSFSTNAGNVGGSIMKIYRDGSIVGNNFADGANSAHGSSVMSGNKTQYDLPIAGEGTVNRDSWTRIAIALDMVNKQYSVYINGSLLRTIDLPKDYGPALRYIRMMAIHNNDGANAAVGAIQFRNMYYHKGDVPLYMTAPKAPVDVFGTTFLDDKDVNKFDDNGYLIKLKGVFDKITNKENFKATISAGKLVITAGQSVGSAENASSGVDSNVCAPISGFDNTAYTVKAVVKFDKTTGEYDIIKLYRAGEGATLPLVYIKDGKINAFGSEYTYTVGEGEEVEITAIIRDGIQGNNYDLYINGIERVAKASFADTVYANTPSSSTAKLLMFNIRDNTVDMGVSVSDLDVYDKDVSSAIKYTFTSGTIEDTVFADGTVSYLVALDNGIVIEDKANFRASIFEESKLSLVYDKANVKTHYKADDEETNSAIALSLENYRNLTFVVKATFTPNATTGGYDVFNYGREDKRQSLVYVEDGKLKIYGNDSYEFALVAGEAVNIELVVNDEKKGDTFSVYVNGVLAAKKVSFNSTEVGAIGGVISTLRMFLVTDADAVMDVMLEALDTYTVVAADDIFGTAFSAPAGSNVFFDGTTCIQDLYGSLGIVTKQNFLATLEFGRLNLSYNTTNESIDAAEAGFDSHVFAEIPASYTAYTINFEVTLKNVDGKFDILKLCSESKVLDIITVNGNTITVIGGWSRTFGADETIAFDIIVNNGKLNVFVGGILVADSVALDTTYTSFKAFNVAEEGKRMDVVVRSFNVYDKEVIPSYYVGKLAKPVKPGKVDNAISFTGTENVLNFAPANSKFAGGYYYEEISGSYLLAIAPADIKPAANINLVKIGGNGTIGADNGVWTLGVGDFKTNGVYPLSFALDSIKTNADNLYDISDYTKMTVSFFVVDNTAGYEIEAKLDDFAVFSGKYATGWHVVEIDLASAPDYVGAFNVNFKGVSGNAEIDGFSFYLCKADFSCDSSILDELEFVYKPAAKLACETKSATNPKGEHTWETIEGTTTVKVVTVPATCDKVGYSYKVCTKCSYVDIEFVNVSGHTFVQSFEGDQPVIISGADCETNGYAKYECTCEGCDAVTVKPIYKTGHNFQKLENATEADGYLAPTCEADGYDVYVCTNEGCNHGDKKFLLKTSKIGHAKADGATESVISVLGCESDGIIEISECANCGESYRVVTKAIGHDYKEVIEAPDCVKTGRKYEKCANCGDEINEETLDALGHTAPAKYLHTPVPETCLNAGGWKYNCTVCGEVGYIADDEDGLPHPHTWGDWTVVTPETCGTDGHKDKTCAECGGLISNLGTDAEKAECVIPMTGAHVWSTEWTYSEDFEAGVRGEKWHSCTEPKCSYTLEGDKPEGAGTEGIVFAFNNINAYVVVGYNGSEKDIVIPSMYKGKPVIVGSAFAGSDIESVVIADGALISAGAFEGCTALDSVKLPADLVAVPLDAFHGCTALKSIELPASCTVIMSGAFYGCSALEEIVIRGTLTEVQMSAFAGCESLTTVKYVTANIPYLVIKEKGNDELLAIVWTKIAE